MSEPVTKRRKFIGTSAPKVTETEWEDHKSQLTRLYMTENLTASVIKAHMLIEHGFIATQQQYQKRFRLWKLNKNIDEASWLSLSRGLKRYGVTLDDLDDRYGRFEVVYNGQPLSFSRVQKAIYRYDTSLLKTDLWLDSPHSSSMDKFDVVLRNFLSRFLLRDNTSAFRLALGNEAIALMLGLSDTTGWANQLSRQDMWTLRERSGHLQLKYFTINEEYAFISCLLSVPIRDSLGAPFRDHDKFELASGVNALLGRCDCRYYQFMPSGLRLHNINSDFDRLTTNALCLGFITCLLKTPKLARIVFKTTEVSRLLRLPTDIQDTYSRNLLNLLLLVMAGCGDFSLCAQLTVGGADPNTMVPGCYCDTGSCELLPYENLHVLQILLVRWNSLDPRLEEVIPILLDAGGDPNLCGRHGHAQPGSTMCCEMSPIYLALRQSSSVFQALLDAGAHLPDQLNLTEAILKIEDPDILSILIQMGVNYEGRYSISADDRFICPLQAVLAYGKDAIALKLLEYVESPLGCSFRKLTQIPSTEWGFNEAQCTGHQSIFWTPLTYSTLRNSHDAARKLLKRGANPNESYFDYLPSAYLRWRDGHLRAHPISTFLNHTSASPLQAAAWTGNFNAVQFLLNVDADPNHPFPLGFSPLTIAIWNRDRAINDLLRVGGASYPCIKSSQVRAMEEKQSSSIS